MGWRKAWVGGGPEGRCVVPVDTGVMMQRGVLSCARSEQGGTQGVVVVVWSRERDDDEGDVADSREMSTKTSLEVV